MSRLTDYGHQELVFRKIRAGELPTYNHLRRFVTALVEAGKQTVLFEPPTKEHLEVAGRWERVLEAVTRLITQSFSPDDCRVLSRVCQGDVRGNLARIDLIMKHLHEIKKAMLEAASRQEAARLAQGGET